MFDGNDEWRLGRIGDLEVEVWFSERHQPSDDGDTADVEEQDSDIDSANSLGQISAWVLRFSCSNLAQRKQLHQHPIVQVSLSGSYSNNFGPCVGERGLGRDSPER